MNLPGTTDALSFLSGSSLWPDFIVQERPRGFSNESSGLLSPCFVSPGHSQWPVSLQFSRRGGGLGQTIDLGKDLGSSCSDHRSLPFCHPLHTPAAILKSRNVDPGMVGRW